MYRHLDINVLYLPRNQVQHTYCLTIAIIMSKSQFSLDIKFNFNGILEAIIYN